MRCGKDAKYTSYVYKTSGPLWKEILSMEVTDVGKRFVNVRMYQCGQSFKIRDRFVGEVSIPLALIKILHPTEHKAAAAKVTKDSDTTEEVPAVSSIFENEEVQNGISLLIVEVVTLSMLIHPLLLPWPKTIC